MATMDRRLLLTAALACCPATRLLAQPDAPRPRHKVSAGELHKALSSRFPVRFDFGGLLDLQVSAPRLLLLPSRNKLGASLEALARGPGFPQPRTGEMDLLFSLRYEAADQSLRAYQPEVLALRMPGLAPEALQGLQALMPMVAREAMGEIVLHQFTQRELGLADVMGFEPEKVTVVDDGLVVAFMPKRR